jgi:hypothetical protein
MSEDRQDEGDERSEKRPEVSEDLAKVVAAL